MRGRERPVPLEFEYRETPLHETIAELVTQGRAPIYLVNFTQRAAAEEAQNLMSVDVCSKPEKEAIRAALDGTDFDTPYGKEIQRFVRHGIGLHHAGLLPKYRLLVERLAQQGLLKVVSGTDTLGVGVNIPIRTVLFTQLCKYDGEKTAHPGRPRVPADRRPRRAQGLRRARVRRRPGARPTWSRTSGWPPRRRPARRSSCTSRPTRGFVHWDRGTFDRLVNGTPEPLVSRFEVTHGVLLNCLQSRSPQGRLPAPGADHRAVARRAARQARRAAARRGLLSDPAARQAGRRRHHRTARGPVVEVSPELQRDFSLNQTLSLYLLEALSVLDRDAPTYALDVLTLVEAIVEDPDPVLRRQLDLLKDEKMAQMKADGVEYDQRIAELEALEWPKPNRDFIYATFDDFAERHPWVGHQNVRPKSVAREMYEKCAAFNEYVRDLGIERSEGVLLRYLSQVWKTLEQTVPLAARTEEMLDVLAYLGTLLRDVDSSLLDEWESLADPTRKRSRPARDTTVAVNPAAERRSALAVIRAELHKLVAALAAAITRPPPAWSAPATPSPGRPSGWPPPWRRSGPNTRSCWSRPRRGAPIAPSWTSWSRVSSARSRRWSTATATRTGRSTAASTSIGRAPTASRCCSWSGSASDASGNDRDRAAGAQVGGRVDDHPVADAQPVADQGLVSELRQGHVARFRRAVAARDPDGAAVAVTDQSAGGDREHAVEPAAGQPQRLAGDQPDVSGQRHLDRFAPARAGIRSQSTNRGPTCASSGLESTAVTGCPWRRTGSFEARGARPMTSTRQKSSRREQRPVRGIQLESAAQKPALDAWRPSCRARPPRRPWPASRRSRQAPTRRPCSGPAPPAPPRPGVPSRPA